MAGDGWVWLGMAGNRWGPLGTAGVAGDRFGPLGSVGDSARDGGVVPWLWDTYETTYGDQCSGRHCLRCAVGRVPEQ